MVAVTLAACTNAAALEGLRDQPILAAPSGAVELARTESAGQKAGFGTPARVEVVWGVDDASAAAAKHIDRFGTDYDLRFNNTGEWLGTRSVDGESVNAAVLTWDGLGSVQWGTTTTEEEDVEPWDGEVLVVRVSSP